MIRGDVESTRYPRNPLDVLAQQIVAALLGEMRSGAKIEMFNLDGTPKTEAASAEPTPAQPMAPAP